MFWYSFKYRNLPGGLMPLRKMGFRLRWPRRTFVRVVQLPAVLFSGAPHVKSAQHQSLLRTCSLAACAGSRERGHLVNGGWCWVTGARSPCKGWSQACVAQAALSLCSTRRLQGVCPGF